MTFSVADFRELLISDIWVMEQFLKLPSDPPTEIKEIEPNHFQSTSFVTYSMQDQQNAVQEYRKNLTPAVFVTAQKVYAELFRLLLGNNGLTAGNKQHHVEIAVRNNLGSLGAYSPFNDQSHFDAWWNMQYSYTKLRKARNHIVHNEYLFDGSDLIVEDENGNILLQWTTDDVFKYTDAVLKFAKSV